MTEVTEKSILLYRKIQNKKMSKMLSPVVTLSPGILFGQGEPFSNKDPDFSDAEMGDLSEFEIWGGRRACKIAIKRPFFSCSRPNSSSDLFARLLASQTCTRGACSEHSKQLPYPCFPPSIITCGTRPGITVAGQCDFVITACQNANLRPDKEPAKMQSPRNRRKAF